MVDYAHLSNTQYLVVFSLGTISMTLSLMGSIVILIVLIRTKKWNELYHRLICGLTVMDLIVTLSMYTQPFLVRSDTNLLFASGNVTTCEWTAFFFQFFLGGTIYNAAVSIYYMLMVTYGKQEAVIAKYLEPWVHIVAFGVPLAFGIAGIFLDVFNPKLFLGICDFAPYPANCIIENDVDCERGKLTDPISWAHGMMYAGLALLGIFCTCRVFWSVRKQTRKNMQYSIHGSLDETQKRRIRAVGLQAMLYSAAFFNGFWVVVFMAIVDAVYTPYIGTTDGLSGLPGVFAANLLIYLLFPLQGFFNCFIYIRPRLLRWRDANPDKSWWWAFQQVLEAKPTPTTVRTAYLRTGPMRRNDVRPPSSGDTAQEFNVNKEEDTERGNNTEQEESHNRESVDASTSVIEA